MRNKLLILVIVVLLLTIAAIIWLLYKNTNSTLFDPQTSENTTNKTYKLSPFADVVAKASLRDIINTAETFTGQIYITAVEKTTDSDTPYDERGQLFTPNTFTISPTEGKTDNPYAIPVWFVDEHSSSGFTFSTKPIDRIDDVSETFIKPLTETITFRINEDVDSDKIFGTRFPAWDATGTRYLYTAQMKTTINRDNSYGESGDWRIYAGMNDTRNEAFYIADGYSADWAFDGEYIIYTKADGIYYKSFPRTEQNVEFKLMNRYGEMGLRNEIDVANNGKILVVAYPFAEGVSDSFVEVYELNKNQNGALSARLVERIMYEDGAPLLSPLFSPEGRYISMISLPSKTNESQMLQIYDLEEQAFVWKYDLGNYYTETIFLSDWEK